MGWDCGNRDKETKTYPHLGKVKQRAHRWCKKDVKDSFFEKLSAKVQCLRKELSLKQHLKHLFAKLAVDDGIMGEKNKKFRKCSGTTDSDSLHMYNHY